MLTVNSEYIPYMLTQWVLVAVTLDAQLCGECDKPGRVGYHG